MTCLTRKPVGRIGAEGVIRRLIATNYLGIRHRCRDNFIRPLKAFLPRGKK
jgi:hypothetical protein